MEHRVERASRAIHATDASRQTMFSSWREPEWSPRSLWGALEGLLALLLDPPDHQLRSLGALLGALGRSRALLDALVTLLGRSWEALGTLLDTLGRSWGALGTLLARFGTLQCSILGSPGSSQSYFKRILSNPSARRRTFRKSVEICPRTVREYSENQIQQRWIASSLLYLALGANFDTLGANLDALGAILDALGANLGALGAQLQRSWGQLGRFGHQLGRS